MVMFPTAKGGPNKHFPKTYTQFWASSALTGKWQEGNYVEKNPQGNPFLACHKLWREHSQHLEEGVLVRWDQNQALWPTNKILSLTGSQYSPLMHYPTVKHGSSSIILWDFSSTAGVVKLSRGDEKTNGANYKAALKKAFGCSKRLETGAEIHFSAQSIKNWSTLHVISKQEASGS